MEINSQRLNLFDYLSNRSNADNALDKLSENQSKDIKGGFSALNNGLNEGSFENTLNSIENGDIDVSVETVENYLLFNSERLASEMEGLSSRFGLTLPVELTIENGEVIMADPLNKDIKDYMDRDVRFTDLVKQTAKLSQFVEWAHAKEGAAKFQSNDMPEEKLISFLQDARKVVNNPNKIFLTDAGVGFSSTGTTQKLIEQYTE